MLVRRKQAYVAAGSGGSGVGSGGDGGPYLVSLVHSEQCKPCQELQGGHQQHSAARSHTAQGRKEPGQERGPKIGTARRSRAPGWREQLSHQAENEGNAAQGRGSLAIQPAAPACRSVTGAVVRPPGGEVLTLRDPPHH
jgi:hypothetical protein